MDEGGKKMLREVSILEALGKVGTYRILGHHLEAIRSLSRDHRGDPTLKKLFDMVEGFFVYGYADLFAREVLDIEPEDYAYIRDVDDLIVEEAASRGVKFTEDEIEYGEFPREEPLEIVKRLLHDLKDP
jgi:hypothetical protein